MLFDGHADVAGEPMNGLATAVTAMILAGGVGFVLARMPLPPVIQSIISSLLGMLLGSLAGAFTWVSRAADEAGVAATSFGVREAVVTSLIVVPVVLVAHWGIERITGTTSGVLRYRPVILGLCGAAYGAGALRGY